MKKALLVLLMITTSLTYAQEKFTIGGGGGGITLDNNAGYNFNLFANYDVWKGLGVGVDAWMANVEDTDFLALHLVAELRDTFEFNLGSADFGVGSFIGPGLIHMKIDELDETKDYFSFLVGINVDYKMTPNWRLGTRLGNHFSHKDLGTVLTANLFLSYSF